jgi:hypothetical protein
VSEAVKPDWVQPGAEVICWTENRDDSCIALTTVKKVAGQSFSVQDEREPRFPFTLEVIQDRPIWYSPRRCVAERHSPEAIVVIAKARRKRAVNLALASVEEWKRTHSVEARKQAIVALQTLDELEEDS